MYAHKIQGKTYTLMYMKERYFLLRCDVHKTSRYRCGYTWYLSFFRQVEPVKHKYALQFFGIIQTVTEALHALVSIQLFTSDMLDSLERENRL